MEKLTQTYLVKDTKTDVHTFNARIDWLNNENTRLTEELGEANVKLGRVAEMFDENRALEVKISTLKDKNAGLKR
jgi:hypothetical protein